MCPPVKLHFEVIAPVICLDLDLPEHISGSDPFPLMLSIKHDVKDVADATYCRKQNLGFQLSDNSGTNTFPTGVRWRPCGWGGKIIWGEISNQHIGTAGLSSTKKYAKGHCVTLVSQLN